MSDPYEVPERRRPSDGTHLVNGVRAAVDAWRANGYSGASATTKRLLGFWFDDEHRTLDQLESRRAQPWLDVRSGGGQLVWSLAFHLVPGAVYRCG